MCSLTSVWNTILVQGRSEVDLLFVVDSSPSMGDEQALLAEQLPRLATTVMTGELVDPETGESRWLPPVDDLHLGLVTTDLGCSPGDPGDDGVLRRTGDGSGSCASSYPPFLRWEPDDALEPAQAHVECVARAGIEGCGYEQPIEAVLKALLPAEPDPAGAFDGRFREGTAHGDTDNAGFLRERSLLSVVVVTDEDDCSVRDPALFDAAGGASPTSDDPSCHDRADGLQPLDRLLHGLLALRPDNPDLLTLSVVGGIPAELVADPMGWDADEILADPRMQLAPRESMPGRLAPSCTSDTGGITAFAPPRLVALAERLEQESSSAALVSICGRDWLGALLPLIRKIAETLAGRCLPRALELGDDGRVDCRLVETLPTEGEATGCDHVPGREAFDPPRFDPETGGELCLVTQVVPDRDAGTVPDEPGWYYDDFSDEVRRACGEGGRDVRYVSSADAEPVAGTRIVLECVQLRPLEAPEGPAVGGSCSSEPGCPGEPEAPGALFCHQGTCQRACRGEGDCPEGQRCLDWPGEGPSICAHPACHRSASVRRGVVGRACEPRWVPPGGFNGAETYVETGHEACRGGACLVYRLAGRPDNLIGDGCPHGRYDCVSADEVARQVTCSCRCDGAGDGPFCACPTGSRCVPVVEEHLRYAASYCISERTLCCLGELPTEECAGVAC